jgi:hypothetical protein
MKVAEIQTFWQEKWQENSDGQIGPSSKDRGKTVKRWGVGCSPRPIGYEDLPNFSGRLRSPVPAGDFSRKLGVAVLPGSKHVGMSEESRATRCGTRLAFCVWEKFAVDGGERRRLVKNAAPERSPEDRGESEAPVAVLDASGNL